MLSKYYDVATVKDAIACPVPSITPQFFQNGEIDWTATARMIDNCILGGAKALLVTHGDSLLHILSDHETNELNRVVADVSGGRAMVIACSKLWNHRQMLEFAQQSRDDGCDLIIPFYPNWCGGLDREAVITCMKELGKTMPIMLLSCMMSGGIPLAVLDALSADDGLVAMKDDVAQPYGKNLLSHTRDRMAYLSGGRAFNFLDTADYGADGYLSVYGRMYPEIAATFWKTYTSGNRQQAIALVEKYDISLFDDFIKKNGLDFSAVIQGMYETAGVGSRWRRFPYSSLNDRQMELLKDFLGSLGLKIS